MLTHPVGSRKDGEAGLQLQRMSPEARTHVILANHWGSQCPLLAFNLLLTFLPILTLHLKQMELCMTNNFVNPFPSLIHIF